MEENYYTTNAGEQWDYIAKKVYGSELYIDFLIENNTQYIDVLEFDAGIVLFTPPLENESDNYSAPIWRQ